MDKLLTEAELKERWHGRSRKELEELVRAERIQALADGRPIVVETGSEGGRLFRIPGVTEPQEGLPLDVRFSLPSIEHFEAAHERARQSSPYLALHKDFAHQKEDQISLGAILEEEPDWRDWISPQSHISLETACCFAVGAYQDPIRRTRWTKDQSYNYERLIDRALAAGMDGSLTVKETAGKQFVGKREFTEWVLPQSDAPLSPEFITRAEKFLSENKTKVKRTIKDERECQAWLVGLMRKGPPSKPKDEYRMEANIGERAFDRAWANAIAETSNTEWSKPGRKS